MKSQLAAHIAKHSATVITPMMYPLPKSHGTAVRTAKTRSAASQSTWKNASGAQNEARFPKKPDGRRTRVVNTAATETICDHSIETWNAIMVSE